MQRADGVLAGRYRLLSPIGSGGMGDVYSALDQTSGRKVAVKLIHAHLSDDPVYVARFKREARIMATIQSPHVVRVLELGRSDGRDFIAMELIDGISLRQLLRSQGTVAPAVALDIASQAAEGLLAAHERNVIHRDVKPENILLLPNGTVKVTDFGIARILDYSTLSSSGEIVGSLRYLAPEALRDPPAPIDARFDIYSLGAVLYEMLTGAPPAEARSVWELVRAHRSPPPAPSIRRPGLPRQIDRIVMGAIAAEPGYRPPGMGDMLRELDAAQGALPPTGPDLAGVVQQVLGTAIQPSDGRTVSLAAKRRTRSRVLLGVSIAALVCVLGLTWVALRGGGGITEAPASRQIASLGSAVGTYPQEASAGPDGVLIAGIKLAQADAPTRGFAESRDEAGTQHWYTASELADDGGANAIHRAADRAVVAGASNDSSGDGSFRGFVVTLDDEGALEQRLVVEGPGNTFLDGVVVSDEVTYAVGSTGGEQAPTRGDQDGLVVALSPNGQETWRTTFGTSEMDELSFVLLTSTSVIVGGYTCGSLAGAVALGDCDGFLSALDSEGNVMWTVQLGTQGRDRLSAGVLDADGNIVAVGQVCGSLRGAKIEGVCDAYAVSVTNDGEVRAEEQFGSAGPDDLKGLTSWDGGFVAVGQACGAVAGQTSAGDCDALVVGIDNLASPTWFDQFGGPGSDTATSAAGAGAELYVVGIAQQGLGADGTEREDGDAFLFMYSE